MPLLQRPSKWKRKRKLKEYYKKNKEKILSTKQIYYQKNKEEIKKRKRDTINKERNWYFEYKKTLSCSRCGISDFRVIDLHHKDPSQKISDIARMVQTLTISNKKIIQEISKCEPICSNCHRIFHWEEKYGK